MLTFKNLTRISLVALILAVAVSAPLKVKAQDEGSDEETIVPPSTNTNTPPPTIIDESDSNGVSDVEEYDG